VPYTPALQAPGRIVVDLCLAGQLSRLPFDQIPRRQRRRRDRLNFGRLGALFIEFTPDFADHLSKAAPYAIFGAFIIGLMYLMPSGAIGIVKFILAHVCRITQFSRSKNFSRHAKFSKL
jgi:hypothetical protein